MSGAYIMPGDLPESLCAMIRDAAKWISEWVDAEGGGHCGAFSYSDIDWDFPAASPADESASSERARAAYKASHAIGFIAGVAAALDVTPLTLLESYDRKPTPAPLPPPPVATRKSRERRRKIPKVVRATYQLVIEGSSNGRKRSRTEHTTLADALAEYVRQRDASAEGASTFDFGMVQAPSGRWLTISYNGRIWDSDHREIQPSAKV